MWELDNRKGWMLKNWCLWTVVLEKTLESHLDYKETKAVNPKGNQTWIFMGRTDAEAEAWILWPPDVKSWLIGKDPDSGKGWRQEKKRMRWLDGITNSMDMNLSKHQEIVKDKKLWHPSVHGVTKSWTWLSYWTTVAFLNYLIILLYTYNFPGGSDGKESACNTGNVGFIPGSGRSPGEGNGYPLQYSCLENSMDREA